MSHGIQQQRQKQQQQQQHKTFTSQLEEQLFYSKWHLVNISGTQPQHRTKSKFAIGVPSLKRTFLGLFNRYPEASHLTPELDKFMKQQDIERQIGLPGFIPPWIQQPASSSTSSSTNTGHLEPNSQQQAPMKDDGTKQQQQQQQEQQQEQRKKEEQAKGYL